jgi:hypothetical protein
MTAQNRPRHREGQKKTPAIENLIFANRLSDNRAEPIRFPPLLVRGLYWTLPVLICSGACSGFLGVEDLYLCISDV